MCFLQDKVDVHVGRETGNAGNTLTVLGFDVRVSAALHYLDKLNFIPENIFTSNKERKQGELPMLILKCCIFRVASSVKVKESKASISFCFLMKERNM